LKKGDVLERLCLLKRYLILKHYCKVTPNDNDKKTKGICGKVIIIVG